MKKRRSIVSKVITLCFMLLLFACSRASEDNKEVQRDRKGRANDEIIVSMGARIPHEFDPKERYGMYNEAHITHSTLLRRTADLEIVGDFAKNYTVSDDGLVWTFDLHDDFKFSNGEPVTAEDVKFSYEMLKEDGKHWDLDFIDKIEIPKENQIVFKLKEPRSTFAMSQLVEVPIVPKAHYNENYKNNPIGSGPYMVVEYKPDEQAIFEINPYYHGKKPYFKKWTWVLLDENTALAALESGDVDMIYATPELADKEVKGCKLFDIESNDVRGLSMPYVKKGVINNSPDGYPVGNDVTSDPIIRKALNVGMNRQKVVDTVLNGHGKPAYSVTDGTSFWNPESVIEDNKPEEAKKMLDEAGWIVGADGIREKNGMKAEFDLYYPTKDALRTNVAVEASSQAKELGIHINLVGSNWEEMITKSHEISMLYAGGRHNPNQFFQSHHPSTAGKGWTNVTFYNNPKVTEYLEKAMRASSLEEANKYWKLAQWDGDTGASTKGDIPYVWLVRINHTYVGDKRIDVGNQGMHSHGHDWSLIANIAEWTWDESMK
ncbi:ABC transporter, substrate-binding protein, family 5 [Fusobacterium necrophorum subsp. funduliforme ATCC 51357]|uniref:Nickel ABC transporter substrate-binding protein n=1 Tax=Fusobacterium necrophorum subsp. funduliforme TaxID=143387 RepID=A0A162JD40_9FUSO|nr:ABC transporter substrate-binding protein [Fusobacterium necrophorum]AYV93106.1 ABC transporter substrate-binding protein [Fusobacterium necrophorum subsp. funduliforme]EIJ67655.1 ABC transporter, substrate-binding protein, family 5 [Fusobacterium necrophorum subsp. funduliforme ATCC 51357]KAB0554241.1 ABC transporter substrate-binding protein [Fusobacterium necrophorum subsp. funduliforme]KYL05563.1 nickel ABC transporter substrate-binding protein [Fusobacterium necrophorum subsp. fundulifo